MDYSPFTERQVDTVRDILGIYETGKLGGDYHLLVVLDDGAGITYGKHQTTENSGGLWLLLYKYYCEDPNASLAKEFSKYRTKLYAKGSDSPGRKYALTKDEEFKDLLVRAAKEDPAMRDAQDKFFDQEYLAAALGVASDYDISIPLGLLQIYDICIHSGVKYGPSFIEKFDGDIFKDPFADLEDDLTEEQEIRCERAWITQLIQYRNDWLANFTSRNKKHQKVVRQCVYRTASTMKLAKEGHWNLEVPFTFTMVRDVIGYKNRTFELR